MKTKTFNITADMLQSKGACMVGMRSFLGKYSTEEYPDGIDYQELLDACAENDRDDYGSWLLDAFGRTNAVLEVDKLESEKSIFFAGSIACNGSIKCAKKIKAGGGIKAGWGIKAGEGIEAGEGIDAGCGIKAGEGIKAGGGIDAGWGIEAGEGIDAGGGIKAGWGIKAGEGIDAGCGIKAGGDYGIYAGLRVRISKRDSRATITAKEEPRNIVCGRFVPIK